MLETAATLGVAWVVGWIQKHRTKIDHKKWGPVANVAIGVGGAFVAGGDVSLAGAAAAVKEGVQLAALAELGLSGTKAARRVAGRRAAP